MKIIKTKRLAGILGCLLTLILTLSLVATPALAVEQMPHRFWGDVHIGIDPAPEGTTVKVQIGETVYVTTTVDSEGRYGYDPAFYVPADDPSTPEREGVTDGETIEFYVADDLATTFTFQISGYNELPLTVAGVVTYSLTVASTTGGSATAPGEGVFIYDTGTVVNLVASPDTGYEFVNWTGEVTTVADDTAASTTITMNGDYSITANFAVITYDLTVASTVGGSVTTPGEGTFPDYPVGTAVDLLAVPLTGYEFVNWTGDVATVADVNAASTTITMNGDYSITANFAVITYDLTVASTAGGSVTTPGEGTFLDYAAGTVVSLVATPATGFQFVSWTGEVTTVADDTAASTTITMNGDYSITANFGEIGVTYDLTVASAAGGSVTTPGEGTFPDYAAGTVVSLVATPDSGYQFVNWTGDVSTIANANAASTTITMNGDYSITANFAEVTGDLGELIAGAAPDETIELGAGTYTGNVTISQPITITGIAGETTISGGIHILPLTGSNVTIENLIITGYTDFGIWIEQVRAVDTFIIRNNTIQGVEGSVGIQVDEVETDDSLTIEQNSILGNETGIKLLAAVSSATIQFNDITGNTVAGLELATGGTATAEKNWWGDISGPKQTTTNPRGAGNEVSGNASYQPWLTRQFATVQTDNIAYFGYAWVSLSAGWNIISMPIALDSGADTWGDYLALGAPDLRIHSINPAYYFDSSTQTWVALTNSYQLKPGDAIYVRMTQADIAPILYSPNTSVPSELLYAGWNLVGLANLEDMSVDEALTSIYSVAGDLTGYTQVVSPSIGNQTAWVYIRGATVKPVMQKTKGYWVFMVNAPTGTTLAGFTFTPISLEP